MSIRIRMCRFISTALFCTSLTSFAAAPVKSIVIFGDSLSDIGNTTHLLKSLRHDENPSYLVSPLKNFVLNKMIEFADDYYVPQIVLDAGIATVTDFFDNQLALNLVEIIGKVKKAPVLPGKPYWNSRFSNGKVWNEYLASMWNIDKEDEEFYTNKAFGGSWTATYDYQLTVWNLIRHPLLMLKSLIVGKLIPPSLGLTIQAHLLEHPRLDDASVYFLLSGGNDYLNLLRFEDNYNMSYLNTYVDNVVGSASEAVKKLTAAGAKHIVIIGLPHVGDTPKYVHTTEKDLLNYAVDEHNQRLEAAITGLQEKNPDVDYLFIDLQSSWAQVLSQPEEFGFTNVTEACIDIKFPMFAPLVSSPFANNAVLSYAETLQYRDSSFAPYEKNYHVCDNPDDYLFWDEIHPSTLAHKHLAMTICKAMKAHGYSVKCQLPE